MHVLRKKLWTRNTQCIYLGPFSDLKPLTAKHVHQVWQKEWNEAVIASSKLHKILPQLSDKLISFCKTRKEDTVLKDYILVILFDGFPYFEKKKSFLFMFDHSQTSLDRVC